MAQTRTTNGWLFVCILLVAYALSFVDRQILSLLVGDLRRDLSIGDTEIGLLQGPAFGVFYAVMGLPFGWLADRVSRVRLIAAGLLLWTIMTALGGYSDNFESLFLTRMGVGVGEAALVPAAVSLLADSFPPARRALPLAIFTSGISVGAGMALLLGGVLVEFARGSPSSWPLFGSLLVGREPWQVVLILAGLLGVPVACLIALLPEPEREQMAEPGGQAVGLLTFLRERHAVLVPLMAGTTCLYFFSNAQSAWMPSLFVRQFGWTPARVGAGIGIVTIAGALCGNILSGLIAARLERQGRRDSALVVMVGGSLLLLPVAVAGPLLSTPAAVQAAVGAIYFAIALCFGVATASLVAVTPQIVRGQVISLYLLLGNLFGLGLGPPTVGIILEHRLDDPSRVGTAIAIVASLSVAAGAFLLVLALKPYRALVGKKEQKKWSVPPV